MSNQWMSNYFIIHKNPTMYMTDAAIDFEHGTYSFTIVLSGTTGVTKYGYNLTIELCKGSGSTVGDKIATLATWVGANNKNPHSEYFHGSFTVPDGNVTYFLKMTCDSTSGCNHSTDPPTGWVGGGSSGNYYAYTNIGSSSVTPTSGDLTFTASTTGKTLTVNPVYSSGGNINVTVNSVTQEVASGGSHTFTGLSTGTPYTVTCTAGGKTTSSLETTFKTDITLDNITDSSISLKAYVNNGYTGNISIWLTYGDNSSTSVKTATNNKVVAFTGLSVNTTYIIHAKPSNMDDAENTQEAITGDIPASTGIDGKITGTTAQITPTFTSYIGNWTGTIGNQVVGGSSNNGISTIAKFSGLQPGNGYDVIFRRNTPTISSSSLFQVNGVLTAEVKYNIRTYAVRLEEVECTTNTFVAQIYQTLGAMSDINMQMTEKGKYWYQALCTTRNGNTPNGESVGVAVPSTDDRCYVRGLEPNTSYRLYVWLKDCKDFADQNDAVGYIDFTTKPTAVAGSFSAKVTGKTCTITSNIVRWNGSNSVNYTCEFFKGGREGTSVGHIDGYCNMSVATPVTMTGLENGTKYYIHITGYDDEGNDVECNDLEIITYGLTLTSGTPHTTYMDSALIYYIDGERASTISQDQSRGANIKWFITDGSNIVDGIDMVNARRSNPAILTTNKKLIPNTSYYLTAYIDGVTYEGVNDTASTIRFTTIRAVNNLLVTTQATGETIGATSTWSPPNIDGYEVTMTMVLSLDGVTKDTKENIVNGETVWFTGLERGKTYTISYSAVDNEGNSTNDYIYYGNTNPIVEETTWKVSIDNFHFTTRAISWKASVNRTDTCTVEYFISQPDSMILNWEGRMQPNSSNQYTRLTHNMNVTLGVRIQNMKDRNGNLDTTEYVTIKMRKLGITMTDFHAHVRFIETYWQALADADNFDFDFIANQNIEFVSDLCTCQPVIRNKGSYVNSTGIYAGGTVTEQGIGEVTYPPKTRYYNGLSGGRDYYIRCGITDGYNTVQSTTYQLSSLLQLVRIYDPDYGDFRLACPYLYHSGTWYKAPIFVYHDGKWRDTNPERDWPPESGS